MGLDMYLTKKTYIKNWQHSSPEQRYTIDVRKGGKPLSYIKPERMMYIEEEVMYWRKANQIHAWFVKNIQNGEDNCGTYYVDTDMLQQLVDKCKEALLVIRNAQIISKQVQTGWSQQGDTYADIKVFDCADEINDILPPQAGFFFGSTDIDEYYKQDMEDTITQLEAVLAEEGSGDFYYHSSW